MAGKASKKNRISNSYRIIASEYYATRSSNKMRRILSIIYYPSLQRLCY